MKLWGLFVSSCFLTSFRPTPGAPKEKHCNTSAVLIPLVNVDITKIEKFSTEVVTEVMKDLGDQA